MAISDTSLSHYEIITQTTLFGGTSAVWGLGPRLSNPGKSRITESQWVEVFTDFFWNRHDKIEEISHESVSNGKFQPILQNHQLTFA